MIYLFLFSVKVNISNWWPPKLEARSMVTNSQKITNITCMLVTSRVSQLLMWVLYKKNSPTRAKKPNMAQLDQIKMAQMAIGTIRIQHCALTQKGLQTRNGDQWYCNWWLLSSYLLCFIQIRRISFDGDQFELVNVAHKQDTTNINYM